MEKNRTTPIAPNPALYLILLAVAIAAALLIALFPENRRFRLCRRTPAATAFPSTRHLPPGFPDDICWQCMESILQTTLPQKGKGPGEKASPADFGQLMKTAMEDEEE